MSSFVASNPNRADHKGHIDGEGNRNGRRHRSPRRTTRRSVDSPPRRHALWRNPHLNTNTQVARSSHRRPTRCLWSSQRVCRHRCRLDAVVRDALAQASVTGCRQAHDGRNGGSRDPRLARVLFIVSSPKVSRATNACERLFFFNLRRTSPRSTPRACSEPGNVASRRGTSQKVRYGPLPQSTGSQVSSEEASAMEVLPVCQTLEQVKATPEAIGKNTRRQLPACRSHVTRARAVPFPINDPFTGSVPRGKDSGIQLRQGPWSNECWYTHLSESEKAHTQETWDTCILLLPLSLSRTTSPASPLAAATRCHAAWSQSGKRSRCKPIHVESSQSSER
ncbi:hypothetical protein MTO96_011033 [Rhipicephalus appendiculatus]